MIVVPDGDNSGRQLLTACVNGYGKRTPLEEYPVKGRGTRGVINIDANDRNGEVVGMKLVTSDTDTDAHHGKGNPHPHPRRGNPRNWPQCGWASG